MQCAHCGAANPDGAKFCMECGTPAAAGCTTCGAELPDGAKFCMECGTPATTSEATPTTTSGAADTGDSGERRLVSVLFADLVGFTPFTESRDSEDVRSMLTAYFDRTSAVIERFGGLVEKYIGDAVMAVWGADSAEEDDAERAVRAALEILDEVRALGEDIGATGLDARVGVLTGEATVGGGGNQSTGMIVGDVVNTAARLQSIAEPGTVLVGETTRGLTASSIEYASSGPASLKGKTEPVPTFVAERVLTSRRGEGRKTGIEPPFVGRDREFRLLKEVLHSAETGLQLVSVVGEPGIGKSRLTEELLKYIDGLADTYYWHHGRCPSYGDGVTFWALAEMVRSRARIAEQDPPDKARLLLRTMVAEYVADPADRTWLEPRLAGLLGLADMPTTDRADLFAAWRTLFEQVSGRGTVVMVFEDLHWADEGMLDFIDNLATTAARSPIIVITLARPDLLERRPTWGSGHRLAMGMRLAPLGDEAMSALITGASPTLDEAAVAGIVERAAGIPLFAVEFIRMVASGQSLAPDALPDSLQAMIGSRIDRLDVELRSLVQDASVLGQSFTIQGLDALRTESSAELTPLLERLVSADLFEVDHDPRSPERGNYRFVQSLIREVAHSRLSRRDRVDRHVAVAEYLAGLDEPSLAAVIASHYVDAYQAAGEDEQLSVAAGAMAALDEASDRAAALHSHVQVVSLFEQARPMLNGSDLLRFMDRATRSAGAYDETLNLEMAQQTLDMANEWGSGDDVLRAATLMARALNDVHRNEEARDQLSQPIGEIHEIETDVQAYAVAELSRALMLTGEGELALPMADRAMEAGERLGLVDIVADSFTTAGTAAVVSGRGLYGRALLHAGADLSADHDLWTVAWRAQNNLISVEGAYDIAVSVDIAEKAAVRALRIGETRQAIVAASWLTSLAAELGQPQRATAILERIDPTTLTDDDASRYDHVLAYHDAALGRKAYVEPPLPDRRGVQRDAATFTNRGAFLNRDSAGAVERARSGAKLWGYSLGTMAGFYSVADAAFMAGDVALLEEVRDTYGDDFPIGTGSGNLAGYVIIGAFIEALATGDRDAVIGRLEEATAHARDGNTNLGLSVAYAAVAAALGTDDPRLQRYAEQAGTFFRESGLLGYLRVFPGLYGDVAASETA